MSDVIVTSRNESKNRYEVHVDGGLAGYTEFTQGDGFVVMPHTEVSDEYEGRGVGSALARGALDDLRGRGMEVLATCPFIHGWIRRHADYLDLLYKGRPSKYAEIEQD